MPESDYSAILKEAMKNQENRTQLEQCLDDSESALESADKYQWGTTGFIVGFLSAGLILYSLK